MRSHLMCHGCFNSIPKSKPLRIPPVTLTKSTTLRFSHGSFSFSFSDDTRIHRFTISPLLAVSASYKPIIQKPDMCPRITTTNNRTVQLFLEKKQLTAAGTTIALACVLAIIGGWGSINVAVAGPREIYQKAPPMVEHMCPMGGKAALKSLLNVIANLATDKLDPKGPAFNLPARPSKEEIDRIKLEAVRQMKLGKPEEAVLILRKAYSNYRNDPEPAYNVEMALVEILICLGRYKEASECNCLKDDHNLMSDDRIILYKAIICTMLDKKEEAKQHWEEFAEAVAEGEDFN
ncbi:hypothetical protein ACFE04_029917 [Oxalis oulophora]